MNASTDPLDPIRPPEVGTDGAWADGGNEFTPVGDTVGDVLRRAAGEFSDREAFVVRSEGSRVAWTFGELRRDAEAVARWLVAAGHAGAPVAVWSPNSADVVLAQMAIALAGAVMVPLNPSLRPDEVAHVLRVSGAGLILVVPDARGADLLGILADVAPAIERVVLDGTGRVLTELGAAADPGVALPIVDGDDLAQLQFTSGTTGAAKAVQITHRAMALTGVVFAQRLRLALDSTILNPMPLFHTAGNVLAVMGALTVGARHVVLRFDPDSTLDAIEAERPTVVSLAPTLLHMVQTHPRFSATDVTSVETVFTGGMTMAPAAMAEVERRFGAHLVITFGMTETCGTALMTSSTDSTDDRHRGVGRVMGLTEVKIVDPEGATVPIGELGELMVRGPRVTPGYFDDPAATAASIDGDGWLRTGDEASMNARGHFRITGRLKDMIKTGGENLSPSEVEDVLIGHPAVDVAAVIGVPDERWGEIVMAFVVPVAGASIDVSELDGYCRDRIASFKVPRRWSVVDDLPRTASGKVQRAVLRDQER